MAYQTVNPANNQLIKTYPAHSDADVEAALCFYAWGMVGMMLAGLENKHLDQDLLADQMLRLLSGEISLRAAEPGAD